MTTYLKYKPGWLQLLIFGSITVGIFLVTGLIGLLAISKIYGVTIAELTNTDFNNPTILAASKALQAVSSVCLFAIPALVFGYLAHEKPLSFLGLKKPQPVAMWFVAIFLILASLPLAGWMGDLNQHMHLPQSMAATEKLIRDAEEKTNQMIGKMLAMRNIGDLLQMIFILAILPAFAEELFFRGVLQRLFINITRRPWLGIIITAFIFSAIHGQFLGFLPRFFLGAILGFIVWYTGSLWPSIIAHFLNNAIQVIAVYKNPEYISKDIQFPFLLIVVSAASTLALLWWMYKNSQTSFAEVFDTDDDLNFDVTQNNQN